MKESWVIAMAAIVLVVAPHAASGGKWPIPAAGESKSGDPEVLFTFDDGPHESYTDIVLDELAKHDIQAIFFWVGHRALRKSNQQQLRLAVIERAVRERHIIGNHTINHAHLCSVKRPLAEQEIDQAKTLYEQLSRLPITLFRAPYGDNCRSLTQILEQRGIRHMHWDIDPREWLDHDSKRTAAYIIGKLKRLEGRAVILMHDTKLATVRALPTVLDWLAEENERRRADGRKLIRVLDASDVIAETLDLDLLTWAKDRGVGAAERGALALAGLLPGYSRTVLSKR